MKPTLPRKRGKPDEKEYLEREENKGEGRKGERSEGRREAKRERKTIKKGALRKGKGRKQGEKEQHRAFPRGPPPQYYPGSNLLNFAVRMGSGEPG